MKKITQPILAIAITILPFSSGFGQSVASVTEEPVNSNHCNQVFYGGVRVTPQLSWMVNKDDMDNINYETLTRFGASFGLAGGYCFNDHFGVELNALYSLEGKRYKLSGKEYTQKSNYLKVPLLFTYSTAPSTFMFIAKAGPQINILSQAKVDPAIVNGTTISDNKEQFENAVVGGVAIAGVRYAATNNLWLDASLRYDISITDVEEKNYKYIPAGRADTRNMTAGVEIGFSYLFK